MLSAQTIHDYDCDAEPSPEALRYLRRSHAQRLTSLSDHSTRAVKVVKIAVHIIRDNFGNFGMSEANINSRIALANTTFQDANIILETCGPFNYIDDTDYSTFDKGTDETIRPGNDVPGAINIYFARRVQENDTTGLCGYAHFPDSSTAGTGTGFTVIGNFCNESTFVHELGHCFGVLHTHSTSNGDELVDRGPAGNCATAGDGFCDTPADPNLSGRVDDFCNYTGNKVDANGDAYTPPTTNIMSYSHKSCRTDLTISQLSSINYSANHDYQLSHCGGGPINCTTYLANFPHTESFEGGGLPLGWLQATDDDGDWTLGSGKTPSKDTGPDNAYIGSQYLYTEASNPGVGYSNKNFGLISPCFNTLNASTAQVAFHYHMHGSNMGSLEVQISQDQGNTWTSLWSVSGNQGTGWKFKNIDLSAYLNQPSLRIRFWATTGAGFNSDIAIDRFYLFRHTHEGYAQLPYADGFEGGVFNDYWTTSSTSAAGRVQVTNANQPAGAYHATLDVSNNGSYSTNRMDLGLALWGETDVELAFDWKEFMDETHASDGVYLSTDAGANWTKIYDLVDGDNQYERVILNLSAIANRFGLTLNNTTKVRWQQYDNYGMTTDGIAVDNILVKDGTSDINDLSMFGAPADESTPLAPALIEGLEYYPNPFTGSMHLQIPEGQGPIESITVYDLTGKLVQEVTDLRAGQGIELGQDFQPGVYLIRVQAQGTQEVFKAIKTN